MENQIKHYIEWLQHFNNNVIILEKATYKYFDKYNKIYNYNPDLSYTLTQIKDVFLHLKSVLNISFKIDEDPKIEYILYNKINNLDTTSSFLIIDSYIMVNFNKNRRENRIKRLLKILVNLTSNIINFKNIVNTLYFKYLLNDTWVKNHYYKNKSYIKEIQKYKGNINRIINLLNLELQEVLYNFLPSPTISEYNKILSIKYNTFVEFFSFIQCNKNTLNIFKSLINNSNSILINKNLLYVSQYYNIIEDMLKQIIINFCIFRTPIIYLNSLD